MADNFLENKFEQMRAGELAPRVKKTRHSSLSLNSLLLKNRSCRGYDSSYIVSRKELEDIVAVNSLIPSARNRQPLRFRLVTSEEAHLMLPHIKLGGALPELHLPLKGTEPNAFIVMCSTVPDDRWLYVDLGISAQSMLLRAVDLGLNGICIGAFDAGAIAEGLGIPEDLRPIMVIAVGRSIEKFQLLPAQPGESLAYFREKGIHFIPKLQKEDLIIK